MATMNKKYNNPLATSVGQSTTAKHGGKHHGQDLVEANHHDAPTVDVRQNINKGHAACY
jgi:hypothetical protein